jgi:hypothetical protein
VKLPRSENGDDDLQTVRAMVKHKPLFILLRERAAFHCALYWALYRTNVHRFGPNANIREWRVLLYLFSNRTNGGIDCSSWRKGWLTEPSATGRIKIMSWNLNCVARFFPPFVIEPFVISLVSRNDDGCSYIMMLCKFLHKLNTYRVEILLYWTRARNYFCEFQIYMEYIHIAFPRAAGIIGESSAQ